MEKMENKINISRKMLLILLVISISLSGLSGCINKSEVLKNDTREEVVKLKYIENLDPIITNGDFPDFKLIEHKYFVIPENITLSLETESFHGTIAVNASKGVPNKTRLYGGSEQYNTGDRYILLQYKIFDKEDKLNDSMNMTIGEYIKAGFKTISVDKNLSDIFNGKRIFVLELKNANRSNTTNGSNIANAVNKSDANIIVILFGYDTVLGKVGIKDSKDMSLDESLKVLDITLNRLKIKSIEMIINKEEMINQSIYGQEA